MTHGMEIYSATGVLQANAEMIGYFCRRSAVAATRTRLGGNTTPSSLVIPRGGTIYPIIAIATNGHALAMSGVDTNNDPVFACSAPVGTQLNYYVFDYAPNIPSSNYGIELYNESGQMTFSSNYFPLQVVSIISAGSQTFPGRTIAAVLQALGGRAIAGPVEYYQGGFLVVPGSPYDSTGYLNDGKLYGGRVTNGGQTLSYDTVSYDDVYIGPEPGDIYVPPDWEYLCPILAVDVTGIPTNTTFF